MVFPVRVLLFCCLTAAAFAAAPVIDEPVQTNRVPANFPVGKTLLFPITAADADGDALSWKATSSNPKITVRVKTGSPSLRMSIEHGGAPLGDMVFQLFRDFTPLTTGFISGFTQAGYYQNLKFHRVVQGTFFQGGDPLGTGAGGPGMSNNVTSSKFDFDNELNPALIFTGRGQLAMANSGYNSDNSGTNGSQIFISLTDLHVPGTNHQANLDFRHTIFGQLLRGWEVADAIGNVPVQNGETPVSDVRIVAAGVEPNNHDAVLILSATGAGESLITLTANDGNGGTATKSFTVTAGADSSNSPPVLLPIPSAVTPESTEVDFKLRAFDLEGDYLFYTHQLLLNGPSNARSTTGGTLAGVLGNDGFTGFVVLGVDVAAFDMAQGGPLLPTVKENIFVGVGDRTILGEAVTIQTAPGAGLNDVVVARLNDLDPAASAANFTTSINWGDGTPVQTGAVSRDASRPAASLFAVTGSHHYDKAGIYMILVDVLGSKGAAAEVRSTVIVTSGDIRADGQQISAQSASVANRILATFTDVQTTGRARDYKATVDWGDGVTTRGVVARTANGAFVVRGSHVYRDAEAFAINVRIHKEGAPASADAQAWSSASLNFATRPHMPPFPVGHMVAQWVNGLNKGPVRPLSGAFVPAALRMQFSGAFSVANGGTAAVKSTVIRFWLSDDANLDASDRKLAVNGAPELSLASYAPGASGQGNLTIPMPVGESAAGKYLLTQLVYNDPIVDYSAVSKVLVVGPILGSLLVFDISGTQTTRSGDAVTLKIVLDTKPTANVTIPLESSDTASGTVSPNSVVFTPDNWSTPQTITVTGHNDGATAPKSYTLKFKSPTSTDPRFVGIVEQTLALTNVTAP